MAAASSGEIEVIALSQEGASDASVTTHSKSTAGFLGVTRGSSQTGSLNEPLGPMKDSSTMEDDMEQPRKVRAKSSEYRLEKERLVAQMSESRFVIDPNHIFLIVWDALLILFLIFYAFVLPFELGVSGSYYLLVNKGWYVWNVLVNTFFFFDTFLYFFRVYYDRNGLPVFNQLKIVRRYVCGFPNNFFLNLIASAPSTIVFVELYKSYTQDQSNGQTDDPDQTLAFLKVLDLLKFFRFSRVSSVMQQSALVGHVRRSTRSYARKLGILTLVLVLVGHWSACLWCFVAFIEARGFSKAHIMETDNWIAAWVNATSGTTGLVVVGWENSLDRYVLSLFWSLQTLTSIGYGNIIPYTAAEYWYACFVQLLSGILWAYIIGSTVSIADTFNQKEDEYRGEMDAANDLIQTFPLEDEVEELEKVHGFDKNSMGPKGLADQIRKFLEEKHRRGSMTNVKCKEPLISSIPMFETLPDDLARQACVQLTFPHLRRLRFMQIDLTNREALEVLAINSEIVDFARGSVITIRHFLANDDHRGAYIVKIGSALTRVGPGTLKLLVRGKSIHQSLCLLERTNPALPKKVKVSIVTFTEFVFIPRSAIMEAFELCPRLWKQSGRWNYLRKCLSNWASVQLSNKIQQNKE